MELKPGYKLTEVGVIPENWEVKSFKELFEFRNGVNADKTHYGQGIRFINVLEPITYSHIYGPEITGQVTLPESVATSYAVRRGDVLFNRTSETQEELGLAATYLGTERVVFGGFVIRGRPTDQSLDPIYSGYALRAPIIRSQIIPMGQGAIRANIGQQNLSLVVAPVPPETEQRAIASALSDMDELLGACDRLIAKKRDLKQATMQQLLTGKTRLPGFDGEWKVKRLGDVLTICHGRSQHEVQVEDGPYPILATGGQIGTAKRFFIRQAIGLNWAQGNYRSAPIHEYAFLDSGHAFLFHCS
ncbi:MAG: restriction endonuclease subunit S [Desertifilum sp.]|nr:restriction endonuclease subunit S [Desertifilum sp.]